MLASRRLTSRPIEGLLLALVSVIAFLGFTIVEVATRLQQQSPLLPGLWVAWQPPLVLALGLYTLHFLLRWRGVEAEQILLPLTGLLVAIGLTMLWRLQPAQLVWQQITRGFLPGVVVVGLLVLFPSLLERVRRDWPLTISLAGLGLLLATAFFGVVGETGARLALKIGPLPAVQTTELVKLALIIFLAWYIESEGRAAEGRARMVGWLRLPPLRYFVPGLLFVSLAALALVRMADFGAVLILGLLFLAMLYAGFQRPIFFTILAIALFFSLLGGLALSAFWEVPAVIQYRFLAFQDPWSSEPLLINGTPTGLTIAEGPGYQIQQAVYAIVDGGLTGTGLGQGTPYYVPLAHSDFIMAAIAEELGAIGALAVLTAFLVLLLRILRLALLLPPAQLFERLLLVGIAAHLLAQLFVMVSGTVNLLPATGVTVPFLSQGGMAMLINLVEIGMVLALAQRAEAQAL